jgi:hypothetical protein
MLRGTWERGRETALDSSSRGMAGTPRHANKRLGQSYGATAGAFPSQAGAFRTVYSIQKMVPGAIASPDRTMDIKQSAKSSI